MSFEVRGNSEAWRLRNALAGDFDGPLKLKPQPASSMDRLMAIALHHGIAPGTIRLLALENTTKSSISPHLVLTAVSVAVFFVNAWTVGSDAPPVQVIAVFAASIAVLWLASRNLNRRVIASLAPVLMTDEHLLVLEGDGSWLRIRREVPSAAIEHATIDDRSRNARMPVTITFHGSQGPIYSTKTATFTELMARFVLHEAKVPLLEAGQPTHDSPLGADETRPVGDQ